MKDATVIFVTIPGKVERRTRPLKKKKSSIAFILKQKFQVFLNAHKCHFTFCPISALLLYFT